MAMTLRLTPEETEALREMAQREGRSMQEVARAAINEYVTRRTDRKYLTVVRSAHRLFPRSHRRDLTQVG